MLSAETLISMADGTKKNINLIQKGDLILNKLNRCVGVKVIRITTYYNHSAIGIQLDNNDFILVPIKFSI